MKKHANNQKGFSLVETLVALSILLVSLVAPLTIASQSLQNIFFAREQYTAMMLAQEGVEAMVLLQRSSMVTAIRNPSTNRAWDWFESMPSNCVGAPGCGVDFSGPASNPVAVNGGNDCNHSSQPCLLQLDPNDTTNTGEPRYKHDTGDPDSPYTRRVWVDEIGGSNTASQASVESVVEWRSSVTQNSESITIRTNLFDVATTTL